MTSVRHEGAVWLGLDVHKDSIAAGVLADREATPRIELIGPDPDAVRRLIKKISRNPRSIRACYEAGPTGYELHRLLSGMGVRCDVIAPSLIPKAAGDRVKTDRRDCARLVRLLRAGELTAIHIPTPAEEAVRDLCRARADVLQDQLRARQRLIKFLLRHGTVYPGRTMWTLSYYRWLDQIRFDERALTETFRHYRAVVTDRDSALSAIDADLAPWCGQDPFARQVRRLVCYRGIADLAGLTFAAEVGDWRRFPSAPSFMAFTGLIPSEHSSGGSQRRGHITHTGNEHIRTQLVESAWAYRYPAKIGLGLQRRQAGAPVDTLARSWAAQQRLCGRYRRLAARKHVRTVVITAIARELAGFLWAEMTANAIPAAA
jgi:transposase